MPHPVYTVPGRYELVPATGSTFFRFAPCFFESWETKFGRVVLHGNAKNNGFVLLVFLVLTA